MNSGREESCVTVLVPAVVCYEADGQNHLPNDGLMLMLTNPTGNSMCSHFPSSLLQFLCSTPFMYWQQTHRVFYYSVIIVVWCIMFSFLVYF